MYFLGKCKECDHIDEYAPQWDIPHFCQECRSVDSITELDDELVLVIEELEEDA